MRLYPGRRPPPPPGRDIVYCVLTHREERHGHHLYCAGCIHQPLNNYPVRVGAERVLCHAAVCLIKQATCALLPPCTRQSDLAADLGLAAKSLGVPQSPDGFRAWIKPLTASDAWSVPGAASTDGQIGSFAAGGRDAQADDAAATQALSGGRSEDSQAGSGGDRGRGRSRRQGAAPGASNGSILGFGAQQQGAGPAIAHHTAAGGGGGGPSGGSGHSEGSEQDGARSPIKIGHAGGPSSSHGGAQGAGEARANGAAALGGSRLPPLKRPGSTETQGAQQSKKRKRQLSPSHEVRTPSSSWILLPGVYLCIS